MEAELGLLIELAVQCLHFPERGTANSSWSLQMAQCQGWGLAVSARWLVFAIPMLPNWTAGVSVRSLWVDRAAAADLWAELLISRLRSIGFNSQHPYGNSHLSVTPPPGDLTPSSGLHMHHALKCTDIHAGKMTTYKIIIIILITIIILLQIN